MGSCEKRILGIAVLCSLGMMTGPERINKKYPQPGDWLVEKKDK